MLLFYIIYILSSYFNTSTKLGYALICFAVEFGRCLRQPMTSFLLFFFFLIVHRFLTNAFIVLVALKENSWYRDCFLNKAPMCIRQRKALYCTRNFILHLLPSGNYCFVKYPPFLQSFGFLTLKKVWLLKKYYL